MDNGKAALLQRYLWTAIEDGYKPLEPHGQWTHDDNMAVQHLGWMIARPPDSEYYDLFALKRTTPKLLMDTIITMAQIDPFCAKAVAIFTAQRMRAPHIKFSFM